jgi:hypothetical protein
MPFAELLARAEYAPGSYSFGPVSVPTGGLLTLRLERFETRPNGTRKPNTQWPIELSRTPLFVLTLERKFVGGDWQPWSVSGPEVIGGVVLRVLEKRSKEPPEEDPYETRTFLLHRGQPQRSWRDGNSGPGLVLEQFRGTLVVNVALQTRIEWEAA